MGDAVTERKVTKFRNKCVSRLKKIYGTDNVKKEWDVAKGSLDDLTRNLYCPRIDIAVGPFNISRRILEDYEKISHAYEENRDFVQSLNSRSIIRIREENELNRNPRCLLAIEIENTGSRKTRVGSIINASAIGKIGVIVAWTPEVLNELERVEDYLRFLRTVGKIPQAFKNILIVGKTDFSEILNLDSTTEDD